MVQNRSGSPSAGLRGAMPCPSAFFLAWVFPGAKAKAERVKSGRMKAVRRLLDALC